MVWLGAENEAYPPAQETPASQGPWLSRPHGVPRRRQGNQGPPPQRPPSPDPHFQPAGALARTLRGRVKRRSRLLRSADFDRTLRSGRRAASDYLALFVSDNEVGRPRVGLAVSRKLGNAVVRNRIKRRLRELVKPLLAQTEGGRDVVIVARARAVDAEITRLRQEMEMLWAKGWGR
jgi:ribonuclease P protein component